ncbi:hypothetical protein J6590_062825 [Homalodisca vitripennis]|nr:hypothetical protein J6590_062825 [Homalodisca vitripennis]
MFKSATKENVTTPELESRGSVPIALERQRGGSSDLVLVSRLCHLSALTNNRELSVRDSLSDSPTNQYQPHINRFMSTSLPVTDAGIGYT